jgi:predicted transcriptional regulator
MATTALRADARVAAALPRELRRQLERLARRNDRSLSGEFRVALREHVARETLVSEAVIDRRNSP